MLTLSFIYYPVRGVITSIPFMMLALLGRVRGGVTRFVNNHPRISLYAVGIVTTTVSVHQYMKIQTRRLESAVYKQMEMGTCPPVWYTSSNVMIPREEISDEIVELFFPHSLFTLSMNLETILVLILNKGKAIRLD